MQYLIDTILTPGEKLRGHDIRLVVDLLRTSSQIITFFDIGGDILVPVETVKDAFSVKDRLGSGWMLIGERGGMACPGFDYGNSPLELIAGGGAKRAVICTSNGTSAILHAASCPNVIIACARNAKAAACKALQIGGRIGIVTAGSNGEFAAEDAVCAGLIIELMLDEIKKEGYSAKLTDGALAALTLWQASGSDMKKNCFSSAHGKILHALGFDEDIAFCSKVNVSDVIATTKFKEGALTIVKM